MRKEEIYLATRCPCPNCSGTRLSDELTNWILDFERYLGKKLILTSGARCEIYNREIGGYWNSPHLIDVNKVGHAVDFQVSGMKPIEIAFEVEKHNPEGRIGIYQKHVHRDFERPNPSKFWYVNGDYIYSGQIKTLKEFLEKLKTERRLTKDDKYTFDNISSNNSGMAFIQKTKKIFRKY